MAALSGTAIRVKTSEGELETRVSEDGTWQFNDLPPGAYELRPVLDKSLVLLPSFGIRGELAPKGCAAVALRAQSNGHLTGHITSNVPLSKYYLAQVGVFRTDQKEIDLIRPFGEVFPDEESGEYDLGPLPPGKYFLAVILTNHDLDEAAIFVPGTDSLEKARIIELGDGETISGLDFTIAKPKFKERPTCCELKIRVPSGPN
ncbi:MAG TPA: carboxypeptidase-like regulatory domain-containing protein [Candidatus Acidoferrum sp.]|nr:carboxypeptidase-like regulatory domain-containing protein [Candidatus Acidoferrum sp.]